MLLAKIILISSLRMLKAVCLTLFIILSRDPDLMTPVKFQKSVSMQNHS